MSAISSYTIKSLKAAPARTVVTILGIALSAALLVAVMSSLTSAYDCLKRGEIERDGAWMTSVVLPWSAESLEEIDNARASGLLENEASIERLHDIELNAPYAERRGEYMALRTASGDVATTCGIRPVEGRMPEAPGEILLPTEWQKRGTVKLGESIELAPGVNYVVCGFYKINNLTITQMEDKTYGEAAFVAPSSKITPSADEPNANALGASKPTASEPTASAPTASATTASEPTASEPTASAPTAIEFYMTFKSADSFEKLTEQTEELFPDKQITYHNRLLVFSGISNYDAVEGAVNGIIFVLAAVIMVACVSLIYNAFAISVNERMRQFGLLASIGASKRQLRNSVLLESVLMSVIGCVFGVALGLGACAIVFSVLQDGLSSMLNSMDNSPFVLVISWQSICIAIGLTLVTVLISAAIPAMRASCVSPIAALRQANVIKISKRAERKALKAHRENAGPWSHRGIAGTIFGVGGRISAITHKRNASKGRSASISLAVSLVLLLTASSLTQQMNTVVSAAGLDVNYDISWVVGIAQDASANSTKTAVDATKLQEIAEYLNAEAQKIPGTHIVAWSITNNGVAAIPDGMAGDGLSAYDEFAKTPAGTKAQPLFINYISDDAFKSVAKENGIDVNTNGTGVPALAIRQGFTRTEAGVKRVDYFKGTGKISFLYSNLPDANIIGLVERVPEVTDRLEGQIVIPISALSGKISEQDIYAFHAIMSMDNSNATEDDVDDAIHLINNISLSPIENMGLGPIENGIINFKAQMLAMQRLITVMTTFCFLFALIVSLIALANVFNTITNGLILRRHEFAVMDSIGMSRKQFRKMIASETCGYALRGMVPGLALGCLAAYGMFNALGIAIEGIEFSLPWAGIGVSLALVAVVVAISLAYGLHRALAGNTVEALSLVG